MKKAIALAIMVTFVLSIAAASFARTLDEEKQAVRDYLQVVDAKIIKYRTAKNTEKVKVLQAEKKATLARWEKLKAAMEEAPAPEVAPAPAPAPAPAAAPSAPAAGMGMSIGGKVGMVAGATGIIGNLDYSIASIIPGTKVRVTGDYLTGTNAGATYKVVDLGVGAIYALDMLKSASVPIDWYVGGSVLVPVKVSSGLSGSFGLAAIVGGTYLIPDFGTLSGELGYGAIKGLNAKGVVASVGYSYAF